MPQPSSRLQARYGSDSVPAEIALNPLIEHLLDHRSVRAYLPDAVTDAELAAIVAAAQSAASASNLNVWSVVAVRDAERRARLAELAGNQAHVREAPLQLVWLADLARLRRIADGLGRPAEGLDYLEMFLTGVIDAALAAQNGAAAAESLARTGLVDGETAAHRAEVAAAKAASEALQNTPAVARSSYIDPRVFDAYRAGRLLDLGRSPDAALRDLIVAEEKP